MITNLLRRLINALFGSSDLTSVARKAVEEKNAALDRVEEARQALLASQSSALTQVRASETAITNAITAENEAETAREQARVAEAAEVVAEGEAEIAALIKALELAQRNAATALANLQAAQQNDRDSVAARVADAQKALAELKAVEATLSQANQQ